MQESKTPLNYKDNKKNALTTILKRFLAFIPQNIVRKILKSYQKELLDETEWIEGVVIFSDISGFTPMSQALSKFGSRGTEEMSLILNTYLSKMTNIIYKNHGILQKIAGDAMTVLFEKHSGEDWTVSLLRAVKCAFEMQKLISNKFRKIHSVAGEFSLAMKIGIAKGRLFNSTLGSYDFGIETCLMGKPIDLAVGAEHNAQQGEIWIHKESLKNISDSVNIITDNNEYLRISKSKEINIPKNNEESAFSVKLSTGDKERIINEVRNCVPPSIGKRIELGYHKFLGEHRKTSILFISFSGISMENPDFEKQLKTYYSNMQKIIARYRGTLYEFESGDKGYKIIALFGSPISTEDDEISAVLCADAMQKAVKDIQWIESQKIGISTGYVFAGVIGTPLLSRYAVIGDKVNLSARLMTVARNNTILVDSDTYKATKSRFVWKKLPPRKLKGKEGNIQTYELSHVKDSKSYSPAEEMTYLIGRNEEVKRFVDIFDNVLNNNGQVAFVIGEMGMGKRSLIREFVEYSHKKFDILYYGAVCYNYGTQI
ncbi:MAG: adenylate/guanylate cyclase domain-containing protein, partial [Spirochaetota bacterium]